MRPYCKWTTNSAPGCSRSSTPTTDGCNARNNFLRCHQTMTSLQLTINLQAGISEDDFPDLDADTRIWKAVVHWGSYNPSHPYRLGDGTYVGGQQMEFRDLTLRQLKWILLRDAPPSDEGSTHDDTRESSPRRMSTESEEPPQDDSDDSTAWTPRKLLLDAPHRSSIAVCEACRLLLLKTLNYFLIFWGDRFSSDEKNKKTI